MTSVLASFRPEAVAGGLLRDDVEVHFYTRLNALLLPEMTVLDYGAGRGVAFLDGGSSFLQRLIKLQGKVRRVIGVDIDDSIFEHPFLDERYIVEENAGLPLGDETVDLITAHWVFEHIRDPARLADEFYRILRPGGWICALTPHRWGYVGLAACIVPNKAHKAALRINNGKDRFDTFYRMNSRSKLKKYFCKTKWLNYSYTRNSTPRYWLENRAAFALICGYQAISWLGTDLVVLLQKKTSHPGA
jgi:SAM-dependent methyltransferase